MATENIKKIIIKKADLPNPSGDNKYYVRYRIISEDKNNTSHWSPLYAVEGQALANVSATVVANGNALTAVWDDENERPAYDIFVKFSKQGSGPAETSFTYHGTSQVHSYSFLKKFFNKTETTIPDRVQIIIQVAGARKVLNKALEIFPGYSGSGYDPLNPETNHIAQTTFSV